jgi:hypothetical protein
MLASARRRCTVFLLAALPQPGETFFRRPFRLGKTKSLLPNALLGPIADTAVLLIQLTLVFSIIALDDGYLLRREDGNPAHDLLEGFPALKVGDEILHGNAAGGELEPTAAIDNRNGF